MQLDKFCLSAFVILVTTFNVKAQEYGPAKDFGSEIGITGMFGKENGLRVGMNRYPNFSGAEYGYTFPIYFAHRSKSSRSNEPFVFESFWRVLTTAFHPFNSRARRDRCWTGDWLYQINQPNH